MWNLDSTPDVLTQNLQFYMISVEFVCMLLFETQIGRVLLPIRITGGAQTDNIRISKGGTWKSLFIISFLGALYCAKLAQVCWQ